MEGNVQTEYASLSGKIHTLVIDKTLSISGAAADARASGERIEKIEEVADESKELAQTAYNKGVEAAQLAADTAEYAKEQVDRVTSDISAENIPITDETATELGLESKASIDEALNALNDMSESIIENMGAVKIKEFTVGTAAAQIDIDVTDIDWEKYQYVYLDIDATGCGVTGTNNLFHWRYNNISDKNYYHAYTGGGSAQSGNTYGGFLRMQDLPLDTYENEYFGPRRVKLTVSRTANRRIVSEIVDPSKSGLGFVISLCGVLYSDLETINFYVTNGTIPVGVKFTFWGAK